MNGDRLPSLGPRGEGWVAIQLVLFALIGLAGLLGPSWSGTARSVTIATGLILIAAGLLLTGFGVAALGSQLTPMPYPGEHSQLVQTGAYRLVRHPIYGGLCIAAFGWGLATASPLAVALAGLLLAFFDLKSRREEAWLDTRFDGYAAYRRRTRRLIPFLY